MGTLDGRVAVVTGAGRGIGRAIALRFARAGARLVINDVDADVAAGVEKEVRALGGEAVAAPGDVREPATPDAVVGEAERAFGGLDVLVNNAGITREAMLHRMTDQEWDLVNDVVLRGAFNMCRRAARLLRPPTGQPPPPYHRKVVNISSINGLYGTAGNVNYSAAKAGLIGLTKAVAREWAPYRINVNAIAPGYIEGTRLTAPREEGDALGIPTAIIDRIVRLIPIGRPGTPDDVAALATFLATADSDYITGQVIEIHGGLEIISLTD